MKKYKYYILLLVLTKNLAISAQKDSLFWKFQHQLTLNLGAKQYWFKSENIGRNAFQEINYICIIKTKQGKIDPLLGFAFNHSVSKIRGSFLPKNSKFNYSYFGMKVGVNIKLSSKLNLTTHIGLPIIRWHDSNVLGGNNSTKLFPSITQINENQLGPYRQVKKIGVFEINISKKMGKNFSLNPGLRYFIVQTSPKFRFYEIKQALYLQMGVSYTF